METKVIDSKIYAFVELKTTLNKLHDDVEKVADKFIANATQKLELVGPMEFIYFDATEDKDKEFTLRLAFPVSQEKEVNGINFERAGNFKCASHEHAGSVSDLHPVYDKFFGEIISQNLKPTNQVREVYHQFTTMEASDNLTEIQIGLN